MGGVLYTRIAIGTTNEGKILAVKNCLARYPEYEHVLVGSCVVGPGWLHSQSRSKK